MKKHEEKKKWRACTKFVDKGDKNRLTEKTEGDSDERPEKEEISKPCADYNKKAGNERKALQHQPLLRSLQSIRLQLRIETAESAQCSMISLV
jgi:hypothetical protein